MEAEYMLPLPEIVSGFFSDGEDLASTASILEIERAALARFCSQAGIQPRRGRLVRITRIIVPSPTRRASVSRWRRTHDQISFARLEEFFDLPRATIRKRWRTSSNILQAVSR